MSLSRKPGFRDRKKSAQLWFYLIKCSANICLISDSHSLKQRPKKSKAGFDSSSCNKNGNGFSNMLLQKSSNMYINVSKVISSSIPLIFLIICRCLLGNGGGIRNPWASAKLDCILRLNQPLTDLSDRNCGESSRMTAKKMSSESMIFTTTRAMGPNRISFVAFFLQDWISFYWQ